MDDDERALSDFLSARDDVSDEELATRMNAAPDLGGALLGKLGSSWCCEHERRRR